MIEIRNFIETIDLKYYTFIEFEMSFKKKKEIEFEKKNQEFCKNLKF